MRKRIIELMFLFVFVFLLSAFSVYAQNENVLNLDQNNDGKFTNTDIRFWIEGYEINLVDARSLLYIIDFVPSDGRVKCTEDFCMDVPYYTDDEIEVELLKRFVTAAIGGELSNETINLDDTSATSGSSYNSVLYSFLSYFTNLKVTGFQAQTGYDPEQYLKENRESSKEKIVNKKVDPKFADDFLNRAERITKENLPTKSAKEMTPEEFNAFQKSVKDKLAQSYGFKDADSITKAVLSALNPFNRNANLKDTLKLKNIMDNIDFNNLATKNGVNVLLALQDIAREEAERNAATVANTDKDKLRITPK